MASMTIRNLDDGLKKRLRIRAAAHGRSMEDEARDILRAALSTGENRPANLAAAIRSRIVPLGGVELELPPTRPCAAYRISPGDHSRHQCSVGAAGPGALRRGRDLACRATNGGCIYHDGNGKLNCSTACGSCPTDADGKSSRQRLSRSFVKILPGVFYRSTARRRTLSVA